MTEKQEDRLFAITWAPGPAWIAGKPIQEQPLDEHRRYFAALAEAGKVRIAGPFLDARSGGLAIVSAPDQAAAARIMSADPAVGTGVFVAEVRPFHPIFGA